MPTPPELEIILTRLGEGGTVAHARVIETIIREETAAAAALADQAGRYQADLTVAHQTILDLLSKAGVEQTDIVLADPVAAAREYLQPDPPPAPEAPAEEKPEQDLEVASDDSSDQEPEWDDAPPVKEPTAAEIRKWCQENNVACSERGGIPTEARNAYLDAHK